MCFWENRSLVVLLAGIIGGMLSILLIPPAQAQFEAAPACTYIYGSGPLDCTAASNVRMHEGPTGSRTARPPVGHRPPVPFRQPAPHTATSRVDPAVQTTHTAYASALRRDLWIARDKALHLSYSFLWTLSSQYVLTHKTALSHSESIPWAITSGVTIGLTKELYDHRRPQNAFSWRDMTANAVGIGLAAGLIAL